MNLHKLLFPKAYAKWMKDAEMGSEFQHESINLRSRVRNLQDELQYFKDKEKEPFGMENIMRASLGLPYLRFDNIETDSKGNDNPPHYLKGLDSQARKEFISYLASVYRDDRFKAVMNWFINVMGNHSFQKAPKETMDNGRIVVIGFRQFRKEFEDATAEYQDSLKDGDSQNFNPQSVLPDLSE